MKIHDVVQGSPEWLALRALFDCASDAPAMMGESTRTMRTDLVRMKATGDEKEFSQWVIDNLLGRGHEVEAYGRKRVEAGLGEDLYPVTGSEDGLLASYDGITIDDVTGFECKLWNEELAAAVRAGATELPEGHHWQLEQQLLVSDDMERIIFVCTDGTPEKYVEMEYRAVAGRAKQLKAGWAQFHDDVKNYVHVEVIPKAVAAPVLALPSLSVSVEIKDNQLVVISNLDRFGERLKDFIGRINKEPADDQAFADADEAVKTLQKAEDALKASEAAALAQTATIDDMRSTVASYSKLARETRLMLTKLVDAKKQEIRDKIRREGAEAFGAHIVALNTRLGKPYMPVISADFAGVMKGMKSIASLRNAVSTELARVKIAANEVADRIQVNLNLLRDSAQGYEAIFADAAQIALKANDDFAVLVSHRIAEQKRKEEVERERIRKEEADRLALAAQAQQATPRPALQVTGVIPDAARPALALAIAAQMAPAAGAAKVNRPTDDHIVAVLADHFKVDGAQVIEWLQEMDLEVLAA